MSKKQSKQTEKTVQLESYFQTDNEHYNEYAFEFYRDVLKDDLFEDVHTPMRLYSKHLAIMINLSATPAEALKQFQIALEAACETNEQRLFICKGINSYFCHTDFENSDPDQVYELLRVYTQKLSQQIKEEEIPKPKATDLRGKLKLIMLKELDQLPELMEGLAKKERLEILIKIMPFVFPKVQNVALSEGEYGW